MCVCVTNWGEAGLGWRQARPTTAYQGFSNNRHNPVMVYNDLMIYIYIGSQLQQRPVATGDNSVYLHLVLRALISVRIIVPFFCMALG